MLTSSTKGKNDMNDGVAMLIDRMKTNPEEFDVMGRDSKWESLIYRFSDWLDEEDKEAFKNAIKQMRQQKFTELVMEELVAPKVDNWADSVMLAKGITSAGTTQGTWATSATTGTTTINANSITLGRTTINEEQLKHMKAHVEALSKQKATPIVGVTQTV